MNLTFGFLVSAGVTRAVITQWRNVVPGGREVNLLHDFATCPIILFLIIVFRDVNDVACGVTQGTYLVSYFIIQVNDFVCISGFSAPVTLEVN